MSGKRDHTVERAVDETGSPSADTWTPDVADLIDELEQLAESVDSPAERDRVEETIDVARRVRYPGAFGRVICGFDRADAAEAFVGSVVFGIPMIAEDGTLEIGSFVASRPPFLVATLAFAVLTVIGLLYVADVQHVEITRPLLGVVPRRLAGVLVISFATAAMLMTVWGRVDWADPWLSFSQVAVTFSGMAIGAALGDILPGS